MATGRKAWPGCRHCWAEARTPPRYPRHAPEAMVERAAIPALRSRAHSTRPDRRVAAAVTTAPSCTMAILGPCLVHSSPAPEGSTATASATGRCHRARRAIPMLRPRHRPTARRLPPARPDRRIAAAVTTAPPRTMAILRPCLVPSSPAPDGSTATASATGRRRRARRAIPMLRPRHCLPTRRLPAASLDTRSLGHGSSDMPMARRPVSASGRGRRQRGAAAGCKRITAPAYPASRRAARPNEPPAPRA